MSPADMLAMLQAGLSGGAAPRDVLFQTLASGPNDANLTPPISPIHEQADRT
jgi:hypothetical protein